MSDKGFKSKRRWAQWLGYIGATVGAIVTVAPEIAPVAVAAFPEYAKPIQLGAFALTAVCGELARRSKNATDNQTTTGLEKVGGNDSRI